MNNAQRAALKAYIDVKARQVAREEMRITTLGLQDLVDTAERQFDLEFADPSFVQRTPIIKDN